MKERNAGLDALRGVAALLVLLHHASWYLGREGSPFASLLLSWFDFGKFGVALFFLISGYVIPDSFRHGFGHFLKGRACRLLPALWLSIALVLAIRASRGTIFAPETVLANMFMVAGTFGQALVIDPYWTLEWELGFYLLCSALFAAGLLDNRRAVVATAFAALAVSFVLPMTIYAVLLLAGSLVRLRAWRSLAVLGPGAALSSALWVAQPDSGYGSAFLAALWLAPPVFLVFLRLAPPRPLVYLGTISFSIYLFHVPVLELVARYGFTGTAFALAGLCASLAVSAAVFRWVEQPFMALAKRKAPAAIPADPVDESLAQARPEHPDRAAPRAAALRLGDWVRRFV